MKAPTILEVTLRDGSYAIDFQFTERDTRVVSAELEKAGFTMIEVGHGVGLGSSEAGKGKAAESDETYCRAAAETLKKAKWGMFCIPGIAKLSHIDMAAGYHMDFIRVGTNVTEMEESEPFIAHAKRHGMFVSSNFMKSYAMPPKRLAEKARLAQKFGSDILAIVDSAGGMMTNDIDDYFHAVQDVCDIPLGFHAHDNLALAVANTLRAIELGATIVDTSLQGMGRSAGNASTEILLALLERKGIGLGLDLLQVMDIGEKYIKPLVRRRGLDSIDIVGGYSQFHSSFMNVILEFSRKYGIDSRRLIMEVCEDDKVNAARERVERIAQRISEKKTAAAGSAKS